MKTYPVLVTAIIVNVFTVELHAMRKLKQIPLLVSKKKCSSKKDGSTMATSGSCQRSWQQTGRCNWIQSDRGSEGSCIPNCNHVNNQKEDMCEDRFCLWSEENRTCQFKETASRVAFCAEQTTELTDSQNSFCNGATTLRAFFVSQAARIDDSKLSQAATDAFKGLIKEGQCGCGKFRAVPGELLADNEWALGGAPRIACEYGHGGTDLRFCCDIDEYRKLCNPTDRLYSVYENYKNMQKQLMPKAVLRGYGMPSFGPTLRIISINVWGHYFAGGGNRDERLRAIAAHVGSQKADVIFVQELFGLTVTAFDAGGSLQMFCEILAHLGFPYHTGTRRSRALFFGQNSGVIIFSRYPMQSASEHTFRRSATKEKFLNNKGFVVARLSWNGVNLVLVNCHLDASPEYSSDQVEQVSDAIDDEIARKHVIVAGDFNICQQHLWDAGELYKKLERSFSPLRDQFGDIADITFPSEGVAYDHVFVPNPNETVVSKRIFQVAPDFSGSMNASDHNAVEVVLSTEALLKLRPPRDSDALRYSFARLRRRLQLSQRPRMEIL